MATKKTQIKAATKDARIIAMSADVNITAAAETEGKKSPPKFSAEFYTGGTLPIDGWEHPVVVDLAGLSEGKVLVANLDHDRTKRVGNFAVANDGKSLVANGTATARTAARDEVIGSAEDGYQWQASLEVCPTDVEEVKKGQTAEANGRTFEGPVYITRKGTLKGFAFVSHGADDNTSVKIAARAASPKEQRKMEVKAEAKTWIESIGFSVDELSETQLAGLVADFEGREGKRAKDVKGEVLTGVAKRKMEAARRKEINEIAEDWCDKALELNRYDEITAIEEARDEAIRAGTSAKDFTHEVQIITLMQAPPAVRSANAGITNKVLEAAVCQAGRLQGYDKQYDDQTCQAAHDQFKGRITLRDLFIIAAESNGYRGRSGASIDLEMHNAAFGLSPQRSMIRAAGFSTISIPNVVSNVANKFLREGWLSVDQTPMRIAAIRSVSDFKQITTVSLTGGFQFEKVGPDGELRSAAPGDMTYTNQADTYGIICALTRKDIRNDDLGALTSVPKRIGRGGMLKLNDIFWTEFLNNSSFFSSGNANVNTGVADITVGGLAATETIFRNQTDPDGKPLGIEAAIVLVPTGSKAGMQTLMTSERLITGSTTTQGDGNIWRDRFRVESSPYMSNSSYTGYDATAWYMLADPGVMPVIEIAALDGMVEPHVETADASFNKLGIEMRGYSDVGVTKQEYRGGVRADGGSS